MDTFVQFVLTHPWLAAGAAYGMVAIGVFLTVLIGAIFFGSPNNPVFYMVRTHLDLRPLFGAWVVTMSGLLWLPICAHFAFHELSYRWRTRHLTYLKHPGPLKTLESEDSLPLDGLEDDEPTGT